MLAGNNCLGASVGILFGDLAVAVAAVDETKTVPVCLVLKMTWIGRDLAGS